MKTNRIPLILCFSSLGIGQVPSGEEILRALDANISSENKSATSTMIIHGRRSSRSMTARSWIQGTEKSFTEYLAPAREKGTKMLKLGDQLWVFSPQSDRTIRIAGHMLRQSMMGSDLSYEDMLEDPNLLNIYHADVLGSDLVNGRDCWVLELSAKVEDIAYYSRKIWVDKERRVALRENRFAKSGKLLKTTEVSEVFQIDDRWYPKKIIFKDALSTGKGTEFIVESIEFDVNLPEYIFTKASLRK